MVRKLLYVLVFLLGISQLSFAQGAKKTGVIKGKVINSTTKTPFADVRVMIPELDAFTNTDGDGNYELSEVPYGMHTLVIGGRRSKADTIKIDVNKDITDVPDITITPNDAVSNTSQEENVEVPTVVPEESNLNTNEETDNNTSSGTEVEGGRSGSFYRSLLWFNFFYHFSPRGYFHLGQEVNVDGYNINNLETSLPVWSQLGRLYDVTSHETFSYGLEPSPYTYGNMLSSNYVHATAADQRKETKVSYDMYSGRQYNNRIMLTHSSGVNKKGWAYSVSVSKTWAEKGYRPGTSYDGYSYYAAVSKVFARSSLNLETFGAPATYGRYAATTNEMYQLSGDKLYNPDWGYQNGKVRDANTNSSFQPLTIASYTYKPSKKTRWITSAGFQFGKYKSTGLDYYNGYNPYPDYYRNLPSYFTNIMPPKPNDSAMVREQILANPSLLQINWNRLYNANYINTETVYNVNGVAGNDVTGKRSVYVLSDRVDALRKWSLGENVSHDVNDHLTLNGGVSVIAQRDEYYRQLADLLGGDFYVNYNQFAAQSFVGNANYYQNNLNDPNAIIKKGDKYGYDYFINLLKSNVWGQAKFTYDRFDFFVAATAGLTSFYRDGMMRNGLFPENSYGKSTTNSFLTYGIKGGITYKINAGNSLFVNAEYSATPPEPNNTYISAETRDFTVSGPSDQYNKTIEGGYILKSPRIQARIAGYATDVTNAAEIRRFYNDDPSILTEVNYVMQNENYRFIGTEIGVDFKITRELTAFGTAMIGQSYYANRPTISIYNDNDPTVTATPRVAYIQNYYLPVGPQSVYKIGLNYRSKKYWHAGISCDYLDRNYVSIDPDRRTLDATDLVAVNSPQWHQIVDQEKLPAAFTLNITAGKSFLLGKKKWLNQKPILYINAGVNNLLNNTDIKVYGAEQLRFDYNYHDANKFPTRYEYAAGINFHVGISLKF